MRNQQHILQNISDKFYSGQSISQCEIAFALGWCLGIESENKRLSAEIADLKAKLPMEVEYGATDQ